MRANRSAGRSNEEGARSTCVLEDRLVNDVSARDIFDARDFEIRCVARDARRTARFAIDRKSSHFYG
jgi:hypothetical protein